MSFKTRLLFLLLPLFSMLGLPVRAASVTVGCAGAVGGPFDYATLGDALTNLHVISFRDHDVTISGVCSEYVTLFDFENLRLIGTAGAVILDPGTSLEPTVTIDRSEHLEIQSLTIRGTNQDVDLIRVFHGSEVQFRDCVIERGGLGMFINSLSHVRVFGTAIQDNGSGVRVAANSLFELGEPGGDPVPAVVQRNAGFGISVDSASSVGIYAATTIQDNGGPGLRLFDGSANLCCEQDERRFLRNGFGINSNQSNLFFNGPTRIEGNLSIGILLNHGSTARFRGDQIIRDNGSVGILVLRNSEIDLNSSLVTGNGDGGIVLRENSSARIRGNEITGNGAEGIQLSYLSTMSLFPPNTIRGNTGFDVYCTPGSRALGSKSGVGKMACPGFDNAPDPQPGGPPS